RSRISRSIWSILSRSGLSASCSELSMRALEFFHEVNKCRNAFHGHCVIDGRPHAANRFVPLERQQTMLRCLLQKLAGQLLAGKRKRHIHAGAERRLYWIGVKIAAIDLGIQRL